MLPTPIDLKLNLNARSELRLRSGDFVSIKVIKRLTGNKWAVGIRGQVIPAFSKVNLAPGQLLRALVTIQQGRITLKMTTEQTTPVQDLLVRQGIQPDKVMEQILTSFLRSGLAVEPERLYQVRRLLEKMKLDPKKFSRIIALILEKGIGLRSRALVPLLPLLGYGEQESGKKEGRKQRRLPDSQALMQQLRSAVEEPESAEGSSLQVFNHLQGSEASWVIIPFDYTYGSSGRIYGSIRLRYDPWRKQTDRLIVVARTEAGRKWSFVLQKSPEDGLELSIFADPGDARRKVKAELEGLRLKLQNLGVKIDDNIREDENFDGFSLPWEELSYRNVDTVH
jgi:hypothetical protein